MSQSAGLHSRFLKDEPEFRAALVSDPAHIKKDNSGDHVSFVHQTLRILDGANIAPDELQNRLYGDTTAAAVLAYKQKRNIINKSYQQDADNIVGKMTTRSFDDELAKLEAGTPIHTGFTAAQIEDVERDVARSRTMLDHAVRRLRRIAFVGPNGIPVITPRDLAWYDAKWKVLNVFHVNTFDEADFPIDPQVRARLERNFRPRLLPSASTDPADGIRFAQLLSNFAQLRRSLDEAFPRRFHPRGHFRSQPLGLFAAFVDARNPADPTVRFTRSYFADFNGGRMLSQDSRAATIAHERAHTIFRANGHPGTGDNPFGVMPHLGDSNVTSFDQAIANAYCYEWLTVALQPDYQACRFSDAGCGTTN
jgi:hypothetical protein